MFLRKKSIVKILRVHVLILSFIVKITWEFYLGWQKNRHFLTQKKLCRLTTVVDKKIRPKEFLALPTQLNNDKLEAKTINETPTVLNNFITS